MTIKYEAWWENYAAAEDFKIIDNVWNQISFLDLERETDIELGTSWPYQDLAADECVLTNDYQEGNNNFAVGDKVAFGGNFSSLWRMVAEVYNDQVRAEGDPEQYAEGFMSGGDYPTLVPCTVRGFISTGEGKYPATRFGEKVIMSDYKNFLPTLFKNTDDYWPAGIVI